MPTLRIFTTTNCPRCPAAKQIAKNVAEKLSLDVEEINLDEDPIMGLQFQVLSTPSIAIDDETIFFGEVPSEQGLEDEIKKYI